MTESNLNRLNRKTVQNKAQVKAIALADHRVIALKALVLFSASYIAWFTYSEVVAFLLK